MTEQTKNFLGIPVEGSIQKSYDRAAEQWPIEKFREWLEPILEHPRFVGLRWRQYTPYFNDGDPCIFSTHGVGIKLSDTPEGVGDYEDGFDDLDYPSDETARVLGRPEGRNYQGVVYREEVIGEEKELGKNLFELNRGIEGGHFNNVLLDAFGDHAEITILKDKILVDEYSHD